jgi:competence protein ComEC
LSWRLQATTAKIRRLAVVETPRLILSGPLRVLCVVALGCSKQPSPLATSTASSKNVITTLSDSASSVAPVAPSAASAAAATNCGGGRNLTVHFYDVGQALAALVDLPDGRHILVDTGDSPKRPGCGEPCAHADQHLLDKLRADLHGSPIHLLWVTHQHSDHIGGAPEVMSAFKVGVYADNGRDAGKSEVRRAHDAATTDGAAVRVVDPEHADSPIAGSPDVKITPIVPPTWPPACSHDPNECSIGLRIDYCSSSVLFTGDAEHDEEATLDPKGRVTLLQVAHHGSDTSTTPGFLAKVHPSYAVISAGKPDTALNRDYCHPRAIIVKRLTTLTGAPGSKSLKSFDGERCNGATPSDWIDVPTSDKLWATERDGDVVLTTTGDGAFVRD